MTLQGKSVMEQRDRHGCSVHGQWHCVQNLLHSVMVGLKEAQRDLLKVCKVDDSVQHHGRSGRIFVLATATIGEEICFFNALTVIEF